MDHEDGLFLSISHKPLVSSLKDSKQQAIPENESLLSRDHTTSL